MIVVDSSYTLALVMPDERRPVSMKAVLADRLSAPTIWPLEIANALRTNLRRGRIEASQADELFARIAALQVDVATPPHAQPKRFFESAQMFELTPYDASYLDLARQLSAGLATKDANLAAAAQRAGIPVHG